MEDPGKCLQAFSGTQERPRGKGAGLSKKAFEKNNSQLPTIQVVFLPGDSCSLRSDLS